MLNPCKQAIIAAHGTVQGIMGFLTLHFILISHINHGFNQGPANKSRTEKIEVNRRRRSRE